MSVTLRGAPGRPLLGARGLSLKSDQKARNKNVPETQTICKIEELAPGQMRIVENDGRKIGVFRCEDGELVAIEDRCSHDDGPLAEGEFDPAACTVECPRHGSLFDLKSGRPRTLPAFRPVETFEVREIGDEVQLEV